MRELLAEVVQGNIVQGNASREAGGNIAQST